MFNFFLQGFLLQASLILALGAQNIFVLNTGLRKQRHLLAAFVCSVCDTILVFFGVLGIATLFIQFPHLKIALGVLGVGFLFYYGILKLLEARNTDQSFESSTSPTTAKKTVLASLGFSLLNPHVYLDTVVLIGGYSTKFSALVERFYFGLGASSFSVIWFFGLALVAAGAHRFLSNSKAMRGVALVSGLILLVLALKLGYEVYVWFKDI